MENMESTETEGMRMPSGHKNVDINDKDKCPFLNKKPKSRYEEPKEQENDEDSESEEEKPTGGCPVMTNGKKYLTSAKNKNPDLCPFQSNYNLPYVSHMRSLFGFKGVFDFSFDGEMKREKWSSYPNFLKHTVFHCGEDIDKARKLEIGHKFFIVDNLKEKGNRRYRKGKFADAIQFYEKGISVLRWLYWEVDMKSNPFDTSQLYKKYMDKVKAEEEGEDEDEDATSNFDSENEDKLKARFKLESDSESQFGENKGDKNTAENDNPDAEWLKDRFSRLMLTTFHDGNVKHFDGEEYKEENEIDMRNSMLFNLYLNMACCYMSLFHFTEARVILAEAEKLALGNSMYLFRSAQSVAYNLDSSLADLEKASKELEQAAVNKKTEKIFQHEKPMLKMLNLHNADEAFAELQNFIEQRIKELRVRSIQKLERVFDRVSEINQIEQMIIDEGKIPEEGPSGSMFFMEDENMEDLILSGMLDKYLTVIDFYQETKEEKQVELAKAELLQHKKMYWEFAFYWHCNITENPLVEEVANEYEIDIKSEKMQKRITNVLKEKGREIFETGKFNIEMFQYVIDEYFKKKQEAKDAEEAEAKGDEPESEGFMSRMFEGKNNMAPYMLAIFVLLGMAGIVFALYSSGFLII